MMLIRFATMAFAFLALAGASRSLAADAPRNENFKSAWLNALANKLGLKEQQQEAIRKSHEEFDKKAGQLEHQLWAQCNAEREAVRQVLNEEQRAKFNEGIRAMRHKELDVISAKLALNAEQRQQIGQVCDQFEKKFEELAANNQNNPNNQNGENAHERFCQLRDQFIEAIRPQLNAEQQAKLPFLIHEEHRRWRDPAVRREHLQAVVNTLGVNDQQKGQIERINAAHEKQITTISNNLAQVRKDEHEAIDKVLTAEQREKMREMRKAYGDEQN